MEQKLNIKLLENQDCCFTAVDSTSIPVDSSNKVNRAFVEFVIKNNSVVFNQVDEVKNISDFHSSTIIPTDQDGLFKYYKLAIPTLEYYKAGDSSYTIVSNGIKRCFYYNQKIYKPNSTTVSTITLNNIDTYCTKINSITDLWKLKDEDTNILYYYEEYFTLCRIKNCMLGRIEESIVDFVKSGCGKCKSSNLNETYRDFLLSTIQVLEWLICQKDYEEADRILSVVLSCDDSLCPQDFTGIINEGGCNCGKS